MSLSLLSHASESLALWYGDFGMNSHSVKGDEAVKQGGDASLTASPPLLFIGDSLSNASLPLLSNVTLPTSGQKVQYMNRMFFN